MLASVPVYVEVFVAEVLQGIVEIKGVLRYADDMVAFEYQAKESSSKTVPAETLDLPLDQLRAVELKRGLWGATILIHPRRLATFEYISGASRTEIVLKVKRKHREQAATLVAQVQQALSTRGGDDVRRIPFRLPDANYGITEVKGAVYVDEAFLVFEVKTGISGGSKKKQQIIKVEPSALDAIRLDEGAFRDRLYIRPKKRDLLRAMPGTYKEDLTLKIQKQYRADAVRLVEEVRQLART